MWKLAATGCGENFSSTQCWQKPVFLLKGWWDRERRVILTVAEVPAKEAAVAPAIQNGIKN